MTMMIMTSLNPSLLLLAIATHNAIAGHKLNLDGLGKTVVIIKNGCKGRWW